MRNGFLLLGFLLCAAVWPAWAETDVSKDLAKTDFDMPTLQGQPRSLLKWNDPSAMLDIHRWMMERNLKDTLPGWKVNQRLSARPEHLGKIISCIGECWLYRGTAPTRALWLSRINEGDEIHTGAQSYLWAMLVDGTLVRLAPETSMSLLEISIAPEEVFFHARINHGYVHWQPRSGRAQKVTEAAETDPLFLPLMSQTANVEWFQRQLYPKATDQEQINLTVSPKKLGYELQQKTLNEMIQTNNSFMKRSHRYLIVAPNVSVVGRDVAMSLFYGVNGPSYFKLNGRDAEEEGERRSAWNAEAYLRGYSNIAVTPIADEVWKMVSADGRTLEQTPDVPTNLAVSELMVKRIPTFMLLREEWLHKSRGLWEVAASPEKLAVDWGYRLWDKDLEKRLDFLREHTRRVETTNLRSLEKIASAQSPSATFDDRYFSRALERYYLGFKRQHAHSRESVRDMSDLHYYGWMLKNARQK